MADDGAFTVRATRTQDVPAIARLVSGYADDRILLDKERVTYYENVQEFRVAVAPDGTVIGCGALHVMWEDLAEISRSGSRLAWPRCRTPVAGAAAE